MKQITHLAFILIVVIALTGLFAIKTTQAQTKTDALAKKEFFDVHTSNSKNEPDLQYIKKAEGDNDNRDTSDNIYKFNLYKQGCNYPAIRLSNLTTLAKIKLKVNGENYVMSAKNPATYFVEPISKNSDTVNIYLSARNVHQLAILETKELKEPKSFMGICANYVIDSLIPTENKVEFKNNEVSMQLLIHELIPINYKKDTLLTSSKTLNALFANLISPFLSQASDLSPSKSYIVMDNVDNYLFLGGSIKTSKRPGNNNQLLITPGVKINTKDGLAAIFDNKKFNSDFGFSLKLTLFGNGSIHYNKADSSDKKQNVSILEKKQLILNYRKSLADELLKNWMENTRNKSY